MDRFSVVGTSAVLTAALFLFIVDYGQSGNHSPDAEQYLGMANGNPVPDPYANRMVVPTLADILPGSAETGFRLLSSLSLLVSLSVAGIAALSLGIRRTPTLVALSLVATSPAIAYIAANPFLADAPALAGITVGTVAFILGMWPTFLVALIVGVAFREGAAAMAAFWIPAMQLKRLAISTLATAAVLLALRSVVESDGTFVYVSAPTVRTWLQDFVRSWGPLWVAAPLGVWSLRRSRRAVTIAAAVLSVSALVLTFVFNDTERMLQQLFPIAVIGTARYLDAVHQPATRAVLVVSVAITPALAFRNELVPESSLLRTSESLRVGVVAVGALAALAAGLHVLRRQAITT